MTRVSGKKGLEGRGEGEELKTDEGEHEVKSLKRGQWGSGDYAVGKEKVSSTVAAAGRCERRLLLWLEAVKDTRCGRSVLFAHSTDHPKKHARCGQSSPDASWAWVAVKAGACVDAA